MNNVTAPDVASCSTPLKDYIKTENIWQPLDFFESSIFILIHQHFPSVIFDEGLLTLHKRFTTIQNCNGGLNFLEPLNQFTYLIIWKEADYSNFELLG